MGIVWSKQWRCRCCHVQGFAWFDCWERSFPSLRPSCSWILVSQSFCRDERKEEFLESNLSVEFKKAFQWADRHVLDVESCFKERVVILWWHDQQYVQYYCLCLDLRNEHLYDELLAPLNHLWRLRSEACRLQPVLYPLFIQLHR